MGNETPIKQQYKKSLDDILKNTPNNKIELPSGGVIYDKDNILSKGHVHIRFMKGEDEEVLLSPKHLKDDTFLEALLEKVVLEPDFNVYDLTAGDRLYLVLASRIMSLGTEFTMPEIKCSNCGAVHENVEFDVEELQERDILHEPVEPHSNKFEFVLPQTGDTIYLSAITGHIEQELQKKGESFERVNKELTISHRVAELLIDSTGIDSGGESPNYGDKLNYIRNLPIKDSQQLRKYSSEINGIPDNTVRFECPKCDNRMKIPVTFGITFFFPNI